MKKKAEWLQKLCEIENRSISAMTEKYLLFFSSSSKETTVSDFEVLSESSKAQLLQKWARIDIINSHLAASLDVSKLSDRKAAVVIASTLKSVGCDPIRRQCLKHRKSTAESQKGVQTWFAINNSLEWQVTWRYKWSWNCRSSANFGIRTWSRSASSSSKIGSWNRKACASADYKTNSWGLSNKIKCLCFDTAAVNTSLRNGVSVLLEQKIEKICFDWLVAII